MEANALFVAICRFAFGTGVVEPDSSLSRGSSSQGSSRSSRADREAQLEERTRAAEERARRAEEVANQGLLYMATCMQVHIISPQLSKFSSGTEILKHMQQMTQHLPGDVRLPPFPFPSLQVR